MRSERDSFSAAPTRGRSGRAARPGDAAADAAESPSKRRRGRRVGRALNNFLSGLMLATIFVASALSLRLSSGPISLSWLIKPAEAALNAELDGWRVEIGDAALRFGRDQEDVGLRLYDVVLFDEEGVRAGGAPEAGARFALGPALRGVVAPISASLHGADALLVRTPEGRFRFAFVNEAGGEPTPNASEADAASQALQSRSGGVWSGRNRTDAARLAASEEGDPANADLETAAEEALSDFADLFAPASVEEDEFDVVARIVSGLTGDVDSADALSRFRSIDISSLRLFYRDEVSGRFWAAPNASLTVERTDRGLEAALAGDVLISPAAPPLSLSVTGVRRPNAETVSISAQFLDAPGEAIASQLPNAVAALNALDGGVSGEVEVSMRLEDGGVDWFDARLRTENAALQLSADQPPLRLDRLVADFSLDAAADRLSIERLEASVDHVDLAMRGEVDLRRDDAEAVVGADGEFDIVGARYRDPAAYDAPLIVDGGAVAFDFDAEAATLTVPRFSLTTGALAVGGVAEIGLDEKRPRVDVLGSIGAFAADELTRYWPKTAAPGAWLWVDRNIADGEITATRFSAKIRDGFESFEIDFDFRALAGSYLAGMSPIVGASGHGRATTERFDLALDAGRIDYGDPAEGGTGRIELAGSRFSIPTFAEPIPPAEVLIQGSGPARAILRLIDEPPLSLVGKLGLDTDAVGGAAQVEAALAFPLAKALRLEDVSAGATAELSNLAAQAPGLGVDVSAPRATLVVDTETLRLEAPAARLGDLTAGLVWRETFAPAPGAPRRVFDLAARLDRDALIRLGAPADAIVGGIVMADASLVSVDAAPTRLELDVDVEQAALEVSQLGWLKPVGAPGALTAEGVARDDGFALTSFSAEVADLVARGSADFSADVELRRLTFEEISVGDATRVSAIVAPGDGPSGWRIDLRGASLDLSSVLARRFNMGAGETEAALGDGAAASTDLTPPILGAPVVLKGAIDRLRFSETALFGGVVADGRIAAGGDLFVEAAAFALAPNGDGAPVSGRYEIVDGARRLEATSEDAGVLLRALGYFEDGRGGRARIDAVVEPDGAVVGELVAEDFVVEDAPELAQILSVGTLFGAVEALRSGGVRFSRARAPFRAADGVLTIEDAAASGPSIGLSLAGDYDRRSGDLRFYGSVSPAFAINGLIADVPVIGDLLTGGSGEGVIGVAYSITGTDQNPDVFVNPLSALAPGPLRKLFHRRDGDVDDVVPPAWEERRNER